MTSSKAARDLADRCRLSVKSDVVKPLDCQEFGEAVTEAGSDWLELNYTAKWGSNHQQ